MTEICPEVTPASGDVVLIKQYPSCFFGTPLLSMLVAQGVDTAVIIGCSTSGCIRATATDAMSHGFRVVVPRECVGDRTRAVHDANLFDIGAKIGDVLPREAVITHFKATGEPARKRARAGAPLDGVSDFQVGQRDFSASEVKDTRICENFE